MASRIGGTTHTFAEHGLYDGLFLLRDEETGTFWDHMTGDAVYGPLVGRSLEVSTLRQTTAGQILGEDPDTRIALSDRRLRADEDMKLGGLLAGVRGRLSGMFRSTVDDEDDRRPTMDLGMGVWMGTQARYYPYELVSARDRAVLDDFGGRRILGYLDPAAFTLAAMYTDAGSASWDGDVLRLSDGTYIEGGVLHDAAGARMDAVRPLQVFTRWYGFALTFPDTEIFGDGPG